MEKFKSILRLRTVYCIVSVVFVLIFLATSVLNMPGWDTPVANAPSGFLLGVSRGFQVGIAGGMLTGLILNIIKYIRALRAPERLRGLYLYENDERQIMIAAKSGSNVIFPCAMVMIAAALVAGILSTVVMVTIICCMLFLLAVCIFLRLYNSKKY